MKRPKKLLIDVSPEIAAQFHPTKNEGVDLNNLTYGSNKKIWWLGECGHEWETPPNNRKKGQGCPYCVGRLLCVDNCLATINPKLAKEWHPIKNKDLTPYDIFPSSGKEVWWQCREGHEWEAKPLNRNSRGDGCPFCYGRYATPENNLAVTHPHLLTEWDYEKNKDLKPEDFKAGSNKKVHWICKHNTNHKWSSVISARGLQHQGCPKCGGNKTSFFEQAIYFYIKKIYKNAENKYNHHIFKNSTMEFDIFIPELNVAIEYDGYWHKDTLSSDEKKNQLCIDNNIELIRLRDEKLPYLKNEKIKVINHKNIHNQKELEKCIKELLDLLKMKNEKFRLKIELVNVEVNLDKDTPIIYQQLEKMIIENSVGNCSDKLSKEWDYVKNEGINIFSVPLSSSIKVWWKCSIDQSHEWKTSVAKRTEGTGCPYCSGNLPSLNYNLAVIYPEVAKQWHPTKNGDLTPYDFTPHSNKKAWWIKNGKERNSKITDMVISWKKIQKKKVD